MGRKEKEMQEREGEKKDKEGGLGHGAQSSRARPIQERSSEGEVDLDKYRISTHIFSFIKPKTNDGLESSY